MQDVPPSFTELMKRANVHLKKVVSQVTRSKHAAATFETLFQEKLQEIGVQVRVDASLHPNGYASGPTTSPVTRSARAQSVHPAAYEGRHGRKRVLMAVSTSSRLVTWCARVRNRASCARGCESHSV